MKGFFVFLSLTIFIVACSKVVLPVATESDAQRAAVKWPNTTLNELAEGKSLYEQHCDKCHGLKKPSSRTEEKWNEIVPDMARKSKIDAKKENLILKYLVTMSTQQ